MEVLTVTFRYIAIAFGLLGLLILIATIKPDFDHPATGLKSRAGHGEGGTLMREHAYQSRKQWRPYAYASIGAGILFFGASAGFALADKKLRRKVWAKKRKSNKEGDQGSP